MQEGLHEYNRRRNQVNLEKRRRKGQIFLKHKKEDVQENESESLSLDSVEKREERRRFYRVLFDENP
ncbi:hypothetical protein MA16_Dca023506 [Dendrobium catenatum]|uniref:Uncharacterized protein n=2 Tax=Dendrobium catenatum TaxID=906689 RepID=A0A2I0WQK0_9ASPA|nr:hypothetical protein MA16_Dca023506 [Dendrobium catenatum]